MKHRVLLMSLALDQGGTERQLTEIALGLDRTRFEPYVGSFRAYGLRADQLREAGVPVIEFPIQSFRSPAALGGIWRMMRFIRGHKISLVHAFDGPLVLYATPVTHYLTTAVMLSSQRAHRGLAPDYHKLLRWTDRLVDGIVVNCQYMKTHLTREESVPERLIRICHNGIDLSQFHPAPALRHASLPGDTFVIGVVCVLRPEKGLDILIDAFAMVRPLRPRMKLVFVGSGSELPELQRRAQEAGVFQDCVWQPATPDVAGLLRNFDIFALPSRSEALSNSLMEAMACGCPAVASNVGGNPELIEHGVRGLLFEPEKPEALAEALRCLIESPEFRRTLARNAEQFIREEFSAEISAARMGQIYASFLE